MAKASKAKQKKWQQHIQSWKENKISLSEYCRETGLKKSSFRYWVSKDKQPTKSNFFIPVSIKPSLPLPEKNISPLILTINDRYKIEVGETFQSATLSKLIQTLEGFNVSSYT